MHYLDAGDTQLIHVPALEDRRTGGMSHLPRARPAGRRADR
jgi:hypothetical protein